MNQQDHESSATGAPDKPASRGWGYGAAFFEGLVTGIRPFGPAFRMLMIISFWVMGTMALGMALIYSASVFGASAQRLLLVTGEGVVMLGALGLAVGCVLAWMKMFRVGFRRPLV